MIRAIKFINSRIEYIVWSMVIALAFYTVFNFVTQRYIFAFTKSGQYCLPYYAWLIKKGEMPGRGDYVSFAGRGIPAYTDGVGWVKIISGMPGDHIISVKIPKQQRNTNTEVIEVNGLPVQKRLQGRVYIYSLSPPGQVLEYSVYEKDTRGLALSMISTQTIPARHYYVSATAPRSYDSRYWGLINEKDILGKAYPIF